MGQNTSSWSRLIILPVIIVQAQSEGETEIAARD